MRKQLALVLSGGGARGALQVGALRALLEGGFCPDLLVGTSAGAINAAMIALHGMNAVSIETLAWHWRDAAKSEILASNYVWVTLSSLFNRPKSGAYGKMREFFTAHGLVPTLRFGDLQGKLFVVAADLNSGCPIVYGADPQQSVLDAVLASAALPPWIPPIKQDGQLLIDGGAVSNLPIEAALAQGATEIIALDLSDAPTLAAEARGWLPLLSKVRNMAEQRQMQLELALAKARGIPVRRIVLRSDKPVEIWDFGHAEELVERGYQIAQAEIARWKSERRPPWQDWLGRIKHALRME